MSITFTEEFFFVLEADAEPVAIAAEVDLSEFNFSPAELQKLRRLARKLEFALSDAFSRQCTVASVVVEVRSPESDSERLTG